MIFLRKVIDSTFYLVHYPFKPEAVQRFLRKFIVLPYSMAVHLDYRGLVDFYVDGKRLVMQSYNTPIEITVFWRGIFNGREGAEIKLWSELIKKADIVLDIGANNGIYALVASVNEKAGVYAFEPVPAMYDLLKENLRLSNTINVYPRKEVISDLNGKLNLFVPNSGWIDVASIDESFAKKFLEDRTMIEVQCDSITVDEFLVKENITTDKKIVCKIDVEGAEDRVVLGMVETMNNYNIIFMAELLNQEYFSKVLKLVPSDYKVYAIKKNELVLCSEFIVGANNYLFTKE